MLTSYKNERPTCQQRLSFREDNLRQWGFIQVFPLKMCPRKRSTEMEIYQKLVVFHSKSSFQDTFGKLEEDQWKYLEPTIVLDHTGNF